MGSFFNQTLCALASALGALISAITLGYTSAASPSLQNDVSINITEDDISWIGAIVPGAALIGSLMAAPLIDSLGRKWVTLYVIGPYAASFMIIATSQSANQIIFSRFLSGLCMGVERVAMSVYMAETIQLKNRYPLMAFPGLFMVSGLVMINVAGNIMDWRMLACLGIGTLILMFIFTLYIPESPYILFKQGNTTECLNSTKWLMDSPEESRKEYNTIKRSLTDETTKAGSISLSSLLQSPYRWSFLVSISLHILQQLMGCNAIISFLSIILEEGNLNPAVAQTYTVIVTFINVPTLFISIYLLSKYDRKFMINVSSIGMVISLITLSAYMWVERTQQLAINLSFVPLLGLSAYTMAFGLGWGPIPWVFLTEGLFSKIRGHGFSIAIATNWAFAFLTTKAFMWQKNAIGMGGIYLVYALFTVFGMVVMHKYQPETFKKNFVEMDNFYIMSYKKSGKVKKS